jgi:hypothetical protein
MSSLCLLQHRAPVSLPLPKLPAHPLFLSLCRVTIDMQVVGRSSFVQGCPIFRSCM